MRVLVTRPEASADTTLRRLGEAGHEALCLPLTRAEHFPAKHLLANHFSAEHLPNGTPARIDENHALFPALPKALVATSAEAIKALRHAPEQLEALRSWPIYGVGAVTAQAASEAGFREVRIGSGDGAGLARLVIGDYGREHRGIVYCAGLPRAADFERIISDARVPMEVLLVYRMRPVRREPGEMSAAVQTFAPEAILFHSREAVRLFFAEIAPAELKDTVRILCLAGRIAAAVPPGCRHVEVAPHPDEPALLALLDR